MSQVNSYESNTIYYNIYIIIYFSVFVSLPMIPTFTPDMWRVNALVLPSESTFPKVL